jgi:DNA-directed RNA polymerase specialized sigma24 family protein
MSRDSTWEWGSYADGEAELSRRATHGDAAAWNLLARRYSRTVEVALLADGWSLLESRDFAQDAWLRLIEQSRRGQLTKLELPGLVITQARFLALDAQRAERRRVTVYATVCADGRDAGLESRVLARADLARARAELARCHSSAQRTFELLHADPPATILQVAERLGLSVQRVRQIVCEVRARLRAALREDAS